MKVNVSGQRLDIGAASVHGWVLGLLFIPSFFFIGYLLLTGDWSQGEGFQENDPGELMQSLYIFLAAMLFLAAAWQADRPDRYVFCGGALVLLLMFERETEAEDTWAEPYFGPVIESDVHYAVVGILLLALLARAWPIFGQCVQQFLLWARSPAAWMTFFAIALYIFSDSTEKQVLIDGIGPAKMVEESIESVAGCFFLASAYLTWAAFRLPARRRHAMPAE